MYQLFYNEIRQISPPTDWMKFNTDGMKAKTNQMKVISYVCRDYSRRIIKKDGRNIENISVLMTKTSTIWTAIKQAIQKNYLKIIIESDSLIVI